MRDLKENKTRGYIFFSAVVIILSSVIGVIYACKQSNIVIPTNANPITNKIVILDAGHGLPDERRNWFHWNY